MKKTYINPAIKVIKIHSQHLLAGSTESVEMGSGTKSTSLADGRESDFDWDD